MSKEPRVVFVKENNRAGKAFMSCFAHDPTNDKEVGFIDLYKDGLVANFHINPEYRGLGWARRLFTFFINQQEAQDMPRLWLLAKPFAKGKITEGIDGKALVKFYQTFGFVVLGKSATRKDATVMERRR